MSTTNPVTLQERFRIVDSPTAKEDIGHGRTRITALVHGYWSSDPMTAYIERSEQWRHPEQPPTWTATFSHSSGGRDTNEQPDDLVAAACFGDAMKALALYARSILDGAPTLEATYQIARQQREAEREAERLEQQRRVEADPRMGEAAADELMARLTFDCYRGPFTPPTRRRSGQWAHKGRTLILIPRGAETGHDSVYAVEDARGTTRWYVNGTLTPRPKALHAIAECSRKSHLDNKE